MTNDIEQRLEGLISGAETVPGDSIHALAVLPLLKQLLSMYGESLAAEWIRAIINPRTRHIIIGGTAGAGKTSVMTATLGAAEVFLPRQIRKNLIEYDGVHQQAETELGRADHEWSVADWDTSKRIADSQNQLRQENPNEPARFFYELPLVYTPMKNERGLPWVTELAKEDPDAVVVLFMIPYLNLLEIAKQRRNIIAEKIAQYRQKRGISRFELLKLIYEIKNDAFIDLLTDIEPLTILTFEGTKVREVFEVLAHFFGGMASATFIDSLWQEQWSLAHYWWQAVPKDDELMKRYALVFDSLGNKVSRENGPTVAEKEQLTIIMLFWHSTFKAMGIPDKNIFIGMMMIQNQPIPLYRLRDVLRS